jgi:WD40 repeat protein
MSDDRELVERLAAIDATPSARWVAELRADLDAAWDTGELPSRHTPPVEPPRRWPTRTRLVASISFAAVAILIVALVVIPRNRDDVQTPSNTAPPVTTTPTPGTTTPSSSTVPPAPGTLAVTSAGSIDQLEFNGSIGFSTDASTLALAGDGYGLRLYDPDTLTMERELECPTTPVQTPDITSFTWNPQVAATWDTDSQVLLTDLMWADRPVGCQVVFNADGTRAARGENYLTYDSIPDLRTMLWNTTDGTLIGALDGHSPRFSLDGTRLVTDDFGTARVWDAATGRPVSEFDFGAGFISSELSGDRSRVLLAGQSRATVLDARTFDPVADVSFSERPSVAPGAINHDGTLIASTDGTTVSVWDVATGALVQSLAMGSPAVGEIDFSPNGTQLVAGGAAVTVWDLATGEEVFTVHTSAMPATFSPDSTLLAIATIGNEPQLFDTATGEQLNESESSVSPFVGFIAFSPDGRTLAVDSGISVDLWTYTRT